MDKNNVIELERRALGADPLTELLKEGAQKLLAQAVESERQDLLAEFHDCRTESGHAGVVRHGYLPERELQTRIGTDQSQNPQSPLEDGRSRDFSVGTGTPVYSQDAVTGSGHTLVVFEGRFQRRNGSSAEGSGGPAGPGVVLEHGIAPETGLGRGIPRME